MILSVDADIEMVFDEESHALDWIFRYGNEALAELEMFPLESLIGSLFENMDSKLFRNYERAVLYSEVMEINDYSPKVDSELKVMCFLTLGGTVFSSDLNRQACYIISSDSFQGF